MTPFVSVIWMKNLWMIALTLEHQAKSQPPALLETMIAIVNLPVPTGSESFYNYKYVSKLRLCGFIVVSN